MKNWKNNALAIVVLVIIWQLFYVFVNEPLIFPSLQTILKNLGELIITEEFWTIYFHTISTLLQAWLLCLCIVTVAVSLSISNKTFRTLLERYCSYFSPLPSFTLVPFFIVTIGFGKFTVIGVMILSVFWSISYQTLAAFDRIKGDWDKHIINLNWNLFKKMRHVYIPATVPVLFSISNMGWTYMWRILITLEIAFGTIGGYFGLGTYIINVKNTLDIDKMYSVLFVIAITGLCINMLLEFFAKKLSYD